MSFRCALMTNCIILHITELCKVFNTIICDPAYEKGTTIQDLFSENMASHQNIEIGFSLAFVRGHLRLSIYRTSS